MKWTVTTAPETRPVTFAQAKGHLRLLDSSEVDYVHTLIDAATDHACTAMACSLLERTITAVFYDGEKIELPYGPVSAVVSVDDDNDFSVPWQLERVGNQDWLRIETGFTYPLTVVYTAGHAEAEDIPADIRLAIMQHVASLYQNREHVAERELIPVPNSLSEFYRLHSRSVPVA